MSQANKGVCLAIFKRSLRVSHEFSIFYGFARNWQKFSNPDFQEFAQKHGINAETVISVYNEGNNAFGVQVV